MAHHPTAQLFEVVYGRSAVRCQERSNPTPCTSEASTVIVDPFGAGAFAVCHRCAAFYSDHDNCWHKHPIERATPLEMVSILRMERT